MPRSNIPGFCYLIHFREPYVPIQVAGKRPHHCQHYLGWTELSVARRLAEHATGHGAKLLRAVRAAGIEWDLVRVWPGVNRYKERQLKGCGGRGRLCPVCLGTPVADLSHYLIVPEVVT